MSDLTLCGQVITINELHEWAVAHGMIWTAVTAKSIFSAGGELTDSDVENLTKSFYNDTMEMTREKVSGLLTDVERVMERVQGEEDE